MEQTGNLFSILLGPENLWTVMILSYGRFGIVALSMETFAPAAQFKSGLIHGTWLGGKYYKIISVKSSSDLDVSNIWIASRGVC